MDRNIIVEKGSYLPVKEREVELVERKGLGHPDSLIDGIMEEISRELSKAYINDFGKILHHNVDKGQICGGAAMGIGFALMEAFVPGQTLSFKDYLIPTCGDIPEIVPIIVESPEPTGPFAAKGVGEPALIPTAPASVSRARSFAKSPMYKPPSYPKA